MGFFTGAATGMANLLSTLNSTLPGEGWTIDKHVDSGDDSELYVSRTDGFEDMYFSITPNLSVNATALDIYGNTGFDTNATVDNQPGSSQQQTNVNSTSIPIRCQTTQMVGPYTNHWILTPNEGPPFYVYIIVEHDAGQFSHMGFGEIIKYDQFSGGQFGVGQIWNQSSGNINSATSGLHSHAFDSNQTSGGFAPSFVRADTILNGAPWASLHSFSSSSTRSVQAGFIRGIEAGLFAQGPLDITLDTPQYPMTIAIQISDTNSLRTDFAIAGTFPDVRAINIANLAPKQEITIGSQTFITFPAKAKNPGAANTEFNSGNYGYSYLKNT